MTPGLSFSSATPNTFGLGLPLETSDVLINGSGNPSNKPYSKPVSVAAAPAVLGLTATEAALVTGAFVGFLALYAVQSTDEGRRRAIEAFAEDVGEKLGWAAAQGERV